MPEERCAILLEEDVAVDPRKYGDLVAPILKLTRVEARIAVRKARGIFMEDLPGEDARRLAEELARDGIRARVVPREQLPALPQPRKVNHLERGEELLTYRAANASAALPWEAILVASCGVVARPEYGDYFDHIRLDAVPPLHAMEGREREVVRENLILKMAALPRDEADRAKAKSGSVFEEIEQKHSGKVRVSFDLITLDLGTWLRVPMEEMGYVYMAGGVKMGGAWGLQLLADDLRAKCPAALTEITLRLLGGADIREVAFPQPEEFARHTAWVALKKYLWPDAGPGPGRSP